jgi:PAS domain S-box-containing protein
MPFARDSSSSQREDPSFGGSVLAEDRTNTHNMAPSIAPAGDPFLSPGLLDSVAAIVVATDLRGLVTHWNAEAERAYGRSWIAAVGRPIAEVALGAAHARTAEPIMATVREAGRWRGELGLPRRDGSTFPASVTISTFAGADGRAAGYIGTAVDLTARVNRDRDLAGELDEVSWRRRIRDALANGTLLVHAQPIVDLVTGEVVHSELLVRMRGKDGAITGPSHFLPVAEESSLIQDIDRWMIGQAAKLAGEGVSVTVNLSAQTVVQSRAVDDVRCAIRRAGADPSLIVFELTETTLLSDRRRAERFAAATRELGCRLALDDFGTGYGGFTYLKCLPVDYLKIDREFVQDVCENAASRHVVRAVVSLARSFGQHTIAEGVEDGRSFDMLRELGVDYAQGHFVGRPGPITLD